MCQSMGFSGMGSACLAAKALMCIVIKKLHNNSKIIFFTLFLHTYR